MKQPSRGRAEKPEQAVNVEWQTRAAQPSAFANALGDALEQVFASGAEALGDVVQGLNRLGSRAPDGQAWTEATFQSEMRKLGDGHE